MLRRPGDPQLVLHVVQLSAAVELLDQVADPNGGACRGGDVEERGCRGGRIILLYNSGLTFNHPNCLSIMCMCVPCVFVYVLDFFLQRPTGSQLQTLQHQ